MAQKYAVETHGKVDVFKFSPSDLILQEDLRGRKYEPDPTALAEDIEQNGQLEPIGIRKDLDGNPIVSYGYTRVKACLLLEKKHGSWPILGMLVRGNDEAAFQQACSENLVRNNLSQVDMAHAVQTWRNRFHKTSQEIAKIFRKSQQWVSQMEKIITLSSAMQKKIHAGEVSVEAALELAGMPVEVAEEIVKEAVEKAVEKAAGTPGSQKPGNGKQKPGRKRATVTAKAVREAARGKAGEGRAVGKARTGRTMADVKAFLLKHVGEVVSDAMLDFIEGKRTEKQTCQTLGWASK